MKPWALLFLFLPLQAQAFLPPAWFIFSKLAGQRDPSQLTAQLTLSVYKPAESTKGADELLGEYVARFPSTSFNEGDFPGLGFLLETEAEKLIRKMRFLDLMIPMEKDLVRLKKEQIQSAKESPRPFYNKDKSVRLMRGKNFYYWKISSPENDKHAYVEKDTFLPHALEGPCPEAVNSSFSGEGPCRLEYQNIWSLKEGSSRSSRILISRGEKNILLLRVERLQFNPKDAAKESSVSDSVRAALDSLLR